MRKGILIILDGYGEGKEDKYNAVRNANTPYLHSLREKSYSLLEASGEDVGLTKGELGGSEVGHMTIGSGRINMSKYMRINNDMKDGSFAKNKTFVSMLNRLKKNKSSLHVIGMMSDLNIHSNITYTIEVIRQAKDYAKNIYVHFITDGRDSTPFESIKYLKLLNKSIKNIPNCHILSVAGRAYSMDRENNMDRTRLAFDAMFNVTTGIKEDEIENYLESEHKKGLNDQFITPKHVIQESFLGLNPKDEIIFTNFREDRMVQMSKMCLTLKNRLTTMIDLGGIKSDALYKSENVKHTLCEYLSSLGLKQAKVSETTKYAHVTYFFNGGREEPFDGEDRIHVLTKKVKDFATTPLMRAREITKSTIDSISKGYDAIIVNFSNPDMVGHTGDYDATVKALEYLDRCVKKVVDKAKKEGYFVIVTADHGNSECMRTENGEPHMAHTLNPVMCVEATGNFKMKKRGGLRDIAPTFIALMGLGSYKYFEGKSLIENIDKKQ